MSPAVIISYRPVSISMPVSYTSMVQLEFLSKIPPKLFEMFYERYIFPQLTHSNHYIHTYMRFTYHLNVSVCMWFLCLHVFFLMRMRVMFITLLVRSFTCVCTGCSLNIVFFAKVLKYSGLLPLSVLPRCQCVYTHQTGRTPAVQQNWQSS